MDSAVLLAAMRCEGWKVHALTVAYGQRHGVELEAAGDQARRWECESHEVVELPVVLFRSALTDTGAEVPRDREEMRGVPVTYVPARNLVMLSLASAWAESLGVGHVFIAVNAVDTSGYPDCTETFVEAFERAAAEGTRDDLRVHAPLVEMSKADIVGLGVSLGVDFSSTRSCYDPDSRGRACGRCDSCVLRRRGFKEAGIEDPTVYSEGTR
jgi:7-cyano-7-deazaguanine synthase